VRSNSRLQTARSASITEVYIYCFDRAPVRPAISITDTTCHLSMRVHGAHDQFPMIRRYLRFLAAGHVNEMLPTMRDIRALEREERESHSYLSAIMGSTREALRAGTQPALNATMANSATTPV
jgi:hypothetical protein